MELVAITLMGVSAFLCGFFTRELVRRKAEEMKQTELKVGDIVQLNPETVGNKAFAACFMVVTEPKSWGAQGYVQALGESRDNPGGQAYYRAQWEEMELVGKAEWVAPCP